MARDWTRLCVVHTAIGYTDEAIELFLAQGAHPEGSASSIRASSSRHSSCPSTRRVAMVRDGRITDVKTVTGLLWIDKWRPEE